MDIRPQAGAQTKFLSTPADICVFGGSAYGGKSYGLLLELIRHINNPKYQGVIFRRESKQITNPGGLRDTSNEIYPHLGGIYRAQPTPQWLFPSGCRITFDHLNQENTVTSWQGSQVTVFGYDELTHFSKFQFFYMLSRARSMSGIKPYIRATTNPDSESWVAEFIEWWIDQDTGYPIPDRDGVLRYMIRINDKIYWSDTQDYLINQYGCTKDDVMSVTFIRSKITDNPLGLKADPSYMSRLKALSKVERARLLDGNWKISPVSGMYFPRILEFDDYRMDVPIIAFMPNDVIKWVRSWDLAASEESEGKNPDWTVGMLVGIRQDGSYVIGDLIRVRRKAAEVRSLVRRTAERDGKDVWIKLPQDPGQSGKEQIESYRNELRGFTVLSRYITKNKLTMAEPSAALWQRAKIQLLKARWNEDLLMEGDQFPEGKHDDQIDALAGAIQALPKQEKNDYSMSGLSVRFREVKSRKLGSRR